MFWQAGFLTRNKDTSYTGACSGNPEQVRFEFAEFLLINLVKAIFKIPPTVQSTSDSMIIQDKIQYSQSSRPILGRFVFWLYFNLYNTKRKNLIILKSRRVARNSSFFLKIISGWQLATLLLGQQNVTKWGKLDQKLNICV